MLFKLTNISVILFITTAVNLVVTYISWRRQDTQVKRYFAWTMLGMTLWTFASALDYSATTIALKVFFAKFEALFYLCCLTLYLMFALAYAGHLDWLGKVQIQVVLWVFPIIASVIVFTNDFHHLIWTHFSYNEFEDNVLIFHHGSGFLWLAGISYLFILSTVFFLWQALRNFSEFSRRQARVILGATFFMIGTNLLYLFNIIPTTEGVDWTSLTFSVCGLLFLVALYGTQFLNIVPIAHHLIIERMPDCILVLDHDNYIIDFNPAMQEKFGLSKKDLGKKIETAMSSWQEVIKLTTSEEELPPIELIIEKPTLSVFDMRLTRLIDESGQLYGKLIVFRNMTIRYHTRQALLQQLNETRELHEKVRNIAERDSLTNAYTRRYLYEKLSACINHKTPFIVALLDIDKFKQINDQYGHTIGDAVLIELTNQLFEIVEENDTVCRYGGEEFVVAIQNNKPQEVLSKFELVLNNFREFCFTTYNINATISIGVAEYPTDSEKLDEILNIADQAMYQAKSAGGNQIIIYSKQ